MKHILPSEVLYRDIKERGLGLSPISTLVVPDSDEPPPTLFQKLGSILSKQKSSTCSDKILPIPVYSNAIFIARKYIALLYKYKIDPETFQLHIEHTQFLQISFPILKVVSCDSRFTQEKSESPLLLILTNGFIYIRVDHKTTQMEQKDFIKVNQILAAEWLTDKECIIVTQDGFLHCYQIVEGALKLREKLNISFTKPEGYFIRNGWLISNIDEEQESIFTLFYAVTETSQEEIKANVYIKELRRNLSGFIQILSEQDYLLDSNNLVYRPSFTINGVGEFFAIQIPKGVLIAKKKYGKYMLIDNLDKITESNDVWLGPRGLVLSIGSIVMELNSIQFADPRCPLRICDVIDIPENLKSLSEYYTAMWPVLFGKQHSIIFVYLKQNKVILSNLVKIDPMKKMMEKANQNKMEQLQIVRDMAMNLGIKKKDFYLKLWTTSAKQNSDIQKYLLPCCDVPSIKRQLKFTLRKRFIAVFQMMKYLDKISEILIANLRVDLNQNYLKEYLKNQFLRRKLKMEQVNKNLDYNIFSNIYNASLHTLFCDIVTQEIDPVEIKMDPLHAMVDQNPYKELKNLEMVFQEFKLLLLEDYKPFLIEFLKKFSNKIDVVIEKFSFLLPNHPFVIDVQRPSQTNEPPIVTPVALQTQPLWFQEITVVQWNAEMSKERIIKELYEYYPTSRIIQSVDEFCKSLYGQQHKRWKHGLISLSLEEYTARVKSLQGNKLYLYLCQYANQVALSQNSNPQISKKILSILQKKNKLSGDDLKICRLYANMHYFMLKNEIIEKNKMTIIELSELKAEDLMALFFLENRQQKKYIFNDFMNLYENQHDFVEVLKAYAKSENCSQIEIQILLDDFAQLGFDFHKNHQEIISALISGMCQKYAVTEEPPFLKAHSTQERGSSSIIYNIQLSQEVALIINRVKQLYNCREIFRKFNCQKLTYQQILDLENDFGIFKVLLEKYFNDDIYEIDQTMIKLITEPLEDSDSPFIEYLPLNTPISMFWILEELRDRVFYSIKRQDFLLIFTQTLIQWKEFQLVKSILYDIYDENDNKTIVQKFQLDPTYIKTEIIFKALAFIYNDEEIIYDTETKEQILRILDIEREDNIFKSREIAKLQLVEVFEGWGEVVHPADINAICEVWISNNKKQVIDFLIEKYLNRLNFQNFEAIYRSLKRATQTQGNVDFVNEQFAECLIIFAFSLLQSGRYEQITQIILFVRKNTTIPINFGLQSQTFLKVISQNFINDIPTARKFIEFFSMNYLKEKQFSIQEIYSSNFDKSILQFWQAEKKIFVNQRYLYKEAPNECGYDLDILWEIANITSEELSSAEDYEAIFYNYFFLIFSLSKPEIGMAKLKNISYRIDQTTQILLKYLEAYNTNNRQKWVLDFDHLIRKYLEGLINIALSRLDIGIEINGLNKLETVIDNLKENKEENYELIKSLTRVHAELKSKFKRTERKERFIHYLSQEKQKAQKEAERRRREAESARLDSEEEDNHVGVFMNWKEIVEKKRTYTKTESHIFDSEKSLIQYIFENCIQSPRKTPKPTKGGLSSIFLESLKEQQNINTLYDSLIRGDLQKLKGKNPYVVAETIKKFITQLIQRDPQCDLKKAIELMESNDIGEKNKIILYRTAKIHQLNVKNSTINKLFTAEYFFTPQKSDEYVYEELKQRFVQLLPGLTANELKELAIMFGHIFSSYEYTPLFYYDILMLLCQKTEEFTSQTVFITQECLAGISQYPDLIIHRYEQMISAAKEPNLRNLIQEKLPRLNQIRREQSDRNNQQKLQSSTPQLENE